LVQFGQKVLDIVGLLLYNWRARTKDSTFGIFSQKGQKVLDKIASVLYYMARRRQRPIDCKKFLSIAAKKT
jgi:hypothetical protein